MNSFLVFHFFNNVDFTFSVFLLHRLLNDKFFFLRFIQVDMHIFVLVVNARLGKR